MFLTYVLDIIYAFMTADLSLLIAHIKNTF